MRGNSWPLCFDGLGAAGAAFQFPTANPHFLGCTSCRFIMSAISQTEARELQPVAGGQSADRPVKSPCFGLAYCGRFNGQYWPLRAGQLKKLKTLWHWLESQISSKLSRFHKHIITYHCVYFQNATRFLSR